MLSSTTTFSPSLSWKAASTPQSLAAAYMLRPAIAEDPFTFCTESSCSDCPVSVTSAGTVSMRHERHAWCTTLMTFSLRAAAGQHPTAEQDPNCQVIVKSPADTSLQGCGYMVANFAQPACATLDLDTTFMVQFCCGTGDCSAAGAGMKRSAKFGRDSASSGGGGLYLKDVNGTVIQPVKVGEVESTAGGTGEAKRSPAPESVFARSNCEEGSWVADPNRDDYTRPADNTQVVLTGVAGPQTISSRLVSASKNRSQRKSAIPRAALSRFRMVRLAMWASLRISGAQAELLLATVARFRVRSALHTKMEVASSPAFTRLSSPPKSPVTAGLAGKLSDDGFDYGRGSKEVLLVSNQHETESNSLVAQTVLQRSCFTSFVDAII
ncbi:hypothetical protein KC326_g163 [Hortaea werneckii]|nr:hypothetical protein KC326_g163 [Hortaea werneckii]